MASTTSGNEASDDQEKNSTPPSSAGSTGFSKFWNSKSDSPKAAVQPMTRSPVLVHSKSAFKPVWDKDRDRDDSWDAASISSDCSESDSNLEWWYTKPPRPTVLPSSATTVSANIVQPDTTVRVDSETRSLVLTDTSHGETFPETGVGIGYHARPIISLANSIVGVATGGLVSPSSAIYKSPPHSATSPLAREIKFDREEDECVASRNCQRPSLEYRHQDATLSQKVDVDSLEEGYLNENGQPIGDDDGRDSGVESLMESRENYRELGWVDSVSRWLWSPEGKKASDYGVQKCSD
ncbi:hypothetical protein FBU30_005858 [Linnemannia zychae]|nr:hypothetical protein FBU30_005858 [Linnemannia zychae]